MSLLSNSVYSSVFMYNPNVLTRPFRHLTIKALIELHHITCVLHDISVLIVRFGDRTRMCKVDTPMSHQNPSLCPSTKVFWLFGKLSYNNASDDGLSLSVSVAVKQISDVILMLGNNTILVAHQINARNNTYVHDGTLHHIN